jgi:metal transporter CNNM
MRLEPVSGYKSKADHCEPVLSTQPLAAGPFHNRMIPARLLLSLASSVLSEHFPSSKDSLPNHLAPTTSSAAFSSDVHPGSNDPNGHHLHTFAKRDEEIGHTELIAFSVLIPILVLLSGVFSGLTLGYMSLDETQLNVLSVSGSP